MYQINRLYNWYFFQAQFQSFGSESKAKKEMQKHLEHHVKHLVKGNFYFISKYINEKFCNSPHEDSGAWIFLGLRKLPGSKIETP